MRTYYPYSGTRGGTTSRSTYCSPGRKTSSRRSLLLRSPLRLGRCLGQEPQLVAVSIWLFSLVVDTGKTQPDDVCWLVVRRLLVPAYPKGALIKKQSFDLVSCSPLAAGKESIYLPSFGRFPPTQSTEIPRIPWWISPTTPQQCGIEFLVWWI